MRMGSVQAATYTDRVRTQPPAISHQPVTVSPSGQCPATSKTHHLPFNTQYSPFTTHHPIPNTQRLTPITHSPITHHPNTRWHHLIAQGYQQIRGVCQCVDEPRCKLLYARSCTMHMCTYRVSGMSSCLTLPGFVF